jgi:prefoldin alpha subunit
MAQVTVDDLLAQASVLKANIDYLQKLANDLTDALASVASAKETVKLLKEKQQDALMAADRRGNLLLRVTGLDSTKVLVHLGLSYYAEVSPEKAEEILNLREQELRKTLEGVNAELAKNLEAYNEIVAILQRIEEEAKRAAGAKAQR